MLMFVGVWRFTKVQLFNIRDEKMSCLTAPPLPITRPGNVYNISAWWWCEGTRTSSHSSIYNLAHQSQLIYLQKLHRAQQPFRSNIDKVNLSSSINQQFDVMVYWRISRSWQAGSWRGLVSMLINFCEHSVIIKLSLLIIILETSPPDQVRIIN